LDKIIGDYLTHIDIIRRTPAEFVLESKYADY